jgi:hypothetical protein
MAHMSDHRHGFHTGPSSAEFVIYAVALGHVFFPPSVSVSPSASFHQCNVLIFQPIVRSISSDVIKLNELVASFNKTVLSFCCLREAEVDGSRSDVWFMPQNMDTPNMSLGRLYWTVAIW